MVLIKVDLLVESIGSVMLHQLIPKLDDFVVAVDMPINNLILS